MPDVDGDACAEVSSHAPRSVWACSPLTPARAGQQQADAEGDRCRGDEDADHGLFASVQASGEDRVGSSGHRLGRGHEPVAHDDFAVRIGGDAGFVGDEDHRRSLLTGHRVIRSMTSSPVSESSDPVGSSAKSTSGWATSPRASATRCAWPPDISPLRWRSKPSSWSRSNQVRASRRASLAASSTEQERQGDVLLGGELGHELAELEDEAEAVASQRTALLLAHRVEALAVEEISPESGTRMPARQWSSVDLPEPLGPITARISPFSPRRSLHEELAFPRTRARGPAPRGRCRATSTTAEPSPRSRRHRFGQCRQPSGGEVDPAQIGLEVEEAVVGEECVDEVALLLEGGELTHPPQVCGPLDVEVASAGRPSMSARTTFTKRSVWRCGAGRDGLASHVSTSCFPVSVMA